MVHTRKHTNTYTYTHLLLHTHSHSSTIHAYTRTYILLHKHTHTSVQTSKNTNTHIHKCTHMLLHKHTHTFVQTNTQNKHIHKSTHTLSCKNNLFLHKHSLANRFTYTLADTNMYTSTQALMHKQTHRNSFTNTHTLLHKHTHSCLHTCTYTHIVHAHKPRERWSIAIRGAEGPVPAIDMRSWNNARRNSHKWHQIPSITTAKCVISNISL